MKNMTAAITKPGKSFNGMTAHEWTQASRSVWTAKDVSSPRKSYHREHGATFPVALAEAAIQRYTAPGDMVLDPFVGVGDTLIACRNLARRGIGFEIYERFCSIIQDILSQSTLTPNIEQQVYNTDCRNLCKYIEPDAIQMTFTSPPYANFIQQSVDDRQTTHKHSRLVSENNSVVKQYGTHESDFGNLEYSKFLKHVTKLMENIYSVTCPGGYNVWVVKDHRIAKKKIPYVPVHGDIMKAGEDAGFTAHDLVIWDQNDQRSLVVLGYPTVFYHNINHTFLVVLRKT